ncbi:PQQ-binding-like beta-propeller repeat protein [Thalassoglobus sp. JC818]|uniref:outer membrane protein assembly factor BamB family protein n=1 Tax=Thalassoglobus sp. JC818 TaxID=3232136 RepID=UPI00345A7709
MPFLEIIHMTGDSERRELSKQIPVTIGSHASADITIDEPDVEILHCRISWGKSAFEAVSLGTGSIDVNGTPVNKAVLKDGDVLRFGSVDLRFHSGEKADVAGVGVDSASSLKPLTEEVEVRREREERSRPSKPSEDVIDDVDEFVDDDDFDGSNEGSLAAGLEALAAESRSGEISSKPKRKSKSSKSSRSSSKTKSRSSSKPASTEKTEPAKAEASSAPPPEPKAPEPQPVVSRDDEMSPRLREAMRSSRQRRPGEEDPLRSPLVLGLAGGAVALMLTGAIFYFIAFRQTTQQEFDQAKAVYDEGKFQNAIAAFNEFILLHPRDELSVKAKELLGLARVRQQIESATPKFPEGLDELRLFIRENSDREADFEALHPEIVNHARKISLESAVAAGRQFNEDFLRISREARTILNTYSPKDAPPTETLNQIESALRVSEAAILRNNVFKDHVDRMEAALSTEGGEPSPLDALKIRRDLIVRYPKSSPTDRNGFENDKQVVSLFNRALTAEKDKVIPIDVEQEAIVEDRTPEADLLTLAFQGRTKIDEISVGKSVVALAKDCLYGVDFVTGEPVWRRVIGLNTPFFPIEDDNLPSVIFFDTNHLELVRLHQTTGQLIWRQRIDDYVSSPPLMVDNTIYLSTDSGRLIAIDLESGQMVGELQFSQPISGAVQLRDEQHLLVAGFEEVLYTISQRPFECTNVSYLGQAPGSVGAPLLPMGPYTLLIENRTDSATLHLLLAESGTEPIVEVDSARVSGRVIDAPVIRGRDLFVPATGQRIYAFNVSDDPGQPPLTAGPVFEGARMGDVSMSLLTGPNGQVWMATDALNRLQLTTDSLQPDGDPISPGLATQPLKALSGFLLNGRSRPYTSAATFTRTDRESLTSDWQIVLGGRPLASTVRGDGSFNLAMVNEAGHAFRVGDRQLTGGPFLTNASVRLPLHPDLVTPLMGAEMSNNRIAIVCGDPEPRLWMINAAGQIEGSPQLSKPLQAPPCPLGDRVVLPIPGALDFARFSGQTRIRGFQLPTGDESEWENVASINDETIVAVTTNGTVRLLKIQASPSPHLAEVAKLELGSDVSIPVATSDSMIAVADASRKLSLLDTNRLDPVATRQFSDPISTTPVFIGDIVLVPQGGKSLLAASTTDLSDVFTIPTNGVPPTGAVEKDSKVVITLQNGQVLYVDMNSHEVTARQTLDATLSDAPFVADGSIFVFSIDGTLYKLHDPS